MYDGDNLSYIEETLASIENQTCKSFECVIVFDGIQDLEFKAAIKQLLNQISFKYHLIDNKENNGLAYCMNAAIEQARGQYIARMDSDDIMLPTRLEMQNIYLNQHTDVDIVGTYITEFYEDAPDNTITYPLEHKAMRNSFGKRNPLAHVSVLMRRSYFEKAGRYPLDTDKDEDTILWLQGFKNDCKFANIPQSLTRVRVNTSFYKRRGGNAKSKADLQNRKRVIRELQLSSINYIYAYARYLIQIAPGSFVKRISYKYLR